MHTPRNRVPAGRSGFVNDDIGRLADEADQILKKAADEKRKELTPDEDKKFDAIHVDIEKASKQVERLEKQDAVKASLGESKRKTGDNELPARREELAGKATLEDADLALRSWLLAGSEAAHTLTDAPHLAAKRMGFSLSQKSLTIRLFGAKPPRSTSPADMDAWQTRAALGVGGTTIGGFTVPDAPMGALEKALLSFGGMRAVSTILRTSTGADLPIPTNNDTANKGAILAENTVVTELDLTFGQLVLQAYKYSSKSVLCSVEFLQDTSINAMDFIGTALGERIGRIQNDHFTVGTGTGEPKGIVAAATASGVTAAGQTTISYDNLIDLIHSVDPSYRENGRFLLHDTALAMIKKTKVLQFSGDTMGAPLWVPGVNSLPNTILEYPYTINQSLAPLATTTKSVLFGDLSKYIIRDCREVTLIRLDERYADFHQVGFLAFARSDGDLLDAGTHPVKYLTQA
jgi:HK97 family phage major capsid protein